MIGAFGIAMVVSAELLAVPLAKIFASYDAELMKMTVSGFRIFALSFIFMGYAIYSSGFFTALNDGLTSALISFLRTLVFQTAAVIFLIAKRKNIITKKKNPCCSYICSRLSFIRWTR